MTDGMNMDIGLGTKDTECRCGSGQQRFPIRDGYGIFLTYVCDECIGQKRKEFRDDIMEAYDHDEPLDAQD